MHNQLTTTDSLERLLLMRKRSDATLAVSGRPVKRASACRTRPARSGRAGLLNLAKRNGHGRAGMGITYLGNGPGRAGHVSPTEVNLP